MTTRIIYRGADSIRFLASHGVTFALPYGHSKKAMPEGWNRPGAGVGADEAIAHLQCKNNVDALAEFVTILDIDYDFPAKVADLGSLAHTAKVWRNNAKERGALLYKVVDGPVLSASWKPEGATSPHAELLAQTTTGNFKKKSIAGYHKGGEYCIVDAQYGIREITRADLILIWAVVAGEELYAEKPAKAHPARAVQRNPIDSHDDLVEQVKAHWPTLAVFDHFGWAKNGTEEERAGEIRVLGHGGLLIKPDGLWFNHSEQVGGDAIDAWAHCTRRDRDRFFVEILEEMANAAGIEVPRRFRAHEPAPLPEGATVLDNGAVVLKTTPTPEPKPRREVPVLTPSVVAKLAQALRGPEAIGIIKRIPRARDIEMWRDVLIQLVTKIAPKLGGWVFDADAYWLGIQLGKEGMSANRNMWSLDRAGIIRYLHTGKTEEQSKRGRPKMRVDLQPLIAELWELCSSVIKEETQASDFITLENDPPTNVHAVYSGAGKYADASMRTLYKYAVARMGHPTVLARPLTASALTTLDYLARHGEATRAELVEEVGMSAGAAAGGTRVLEQLGFVSVEWEGPGHPKIYVLRPDWEAHLRYLIPHMASYGAMYRLRIRTFSKRIEYIDWLLKGERNLVTISQLKERRKTLEVERRKWCIRANKIGAYGRFAPEPSNWGMAA